MRRLCSRLAAVSLLILGVAAASVHAKESGRSPTIHVAIVDDADKISPVSSSSSSPASAWQPSSEPDCKVSGCACGMWWGGCTLYSVDPPPESERFHKPVPLNINPGFQNVPFNSNLRHYNVGQPPARAIRRQAPAAVDLAARGGGVEGLPQGLRVRCCSHCC